MNLNEFKQEIDFGIQDYPNNWRYGQKVFNYLDIKYKVARTVQFSDEVDCYYDDSKVDSFIEKAYNRLFANNNAPYKIFKELKKYFENTPKEKLEEDWEELKHWNDIGPDVIEYCNMIKKQLDNKLN